MSVCVCVCVHVHVRVCDVMSILPSHPHRPAPKDEDEMMEAIFEYIDRIFNIVRPRRLLYMAIDGVVRGWGRRGREECVCEGEGVGMSSYI